MMTDDPIGNRTSGGFPVNEPLQALENDHDIVKKLFERYLGTQDQQVRQQAGQQILTLLEIHTALEEATFYPTVRQADASLVDECKEQHDQADQLIQQIKGRDPGDPQCEALFRQLNDAVTQHIDVEEHQLFPKVRQANIDMEAMGLQMAAFESNMVSAQAQGSESGTTRRT